MCTATSQIDSSQQYFYELQIYEMMSQILNTTAVQAIVSRLRVLKKTGGHHRTPTMFVVVALSIRDAWSVLAFKVLHWRAG